MPVVSSLAECAAFYWGCLSMPQRCALRRGLPGRSWTLGTACSGSDSVVRVLEHIGRSCGWEFKHLFSCECDPAKQAWVREHWPDLPLLFRDICQLHTGRCVNDMTGLPADVPAVDIFIAGFVCKSVSSENNHRDMHGNCILTGTGKTGSTFEGLRRYVREVRPKIVICENVVGLLKRTRGGRPQIDDVREAFDGLGYHFAYRHVDARRYLLPHRRTRVWMWAIREDISAAPAAIREDISAAPAAPAASAVPAVSAAPAASKVNAILEQLEQLEPAPLGPFLEAAAGGERPRQELNARENMALDAVVRTGPVQRLTKPALEGLVVDLRGSEGRAPWCAGAAPCVLPRSRLYWQHGQCVLGPRQSAALQGIWPADFAGVVEWCEDQRRSHVVMDIAGNAFTSTVCMAVCLAVLLAISG